jgi:hypothetical protein
MLLGIFEDFGWFFIPGRIEEGSTGAGQPPILKYLTSAILTSIKTRLPEQQETNGSSSLFGQRRGLSSS